MTSSFDRTTGPSRPPSRDWESTRVQTQLATRLAGSDDDAEAHDIGRPVGNDLRELFVACEPAEALLQQFDHLGLEFVAVHDLGSNASRKLLAGIAAATGQPVQRLAIRRPGGGQELATIEYVDSPASHGGTVRLYSTTVEADTATRQALSRVLLARSQLGVVLTGDLPGHALSSAIEPWRHAARGGDWTCRRLLFMPLAGGAALSTEITRFRGGSLLDCTTTPRVTRPAEVWTYLCAAWNLMHQTRHPDRDAAGLPLLGVAATAAGAPDTPAAEAPARPPAPAPQAPTPMPTIGTPPPPRDAPLERYLHDLGQLPGVVSACIFDTASGAAVGHAGSRPGPDELARHGSAVLAALTTASRAMGLGATVPDTTVTLGQHHLLLRPVPAHPGMALHAVLDKPHATFALVLVQLRRLDEELLAAGRPAAPPA